MFCQEEIYSKDLIEVPITEPLSLNQINSFSALQKVSLHFPSQRPLHICDQSSKRLGQSLEAAEAEDDNRKVDSAMKMGKTMKSPRSMISLKTKTRKTEPNFKLPDAPQTDHDSRVVHLISCINPSMAPSSYLNLHLNQPSHSQLIAPFAPPPAITQTPSLRNRPLLQQ